MEYTPEQFAKLMGQFASGLPGEVSRAEVAVGQQLYSEIKGRIFADGGTKDIGGGTRGYRSESWVNEREDRGFSINRVNMVFEGDLQASIELMEVQKGVDVVIVGASNVKKARDADKIFEEENGSPVFEASTAEEKNAQKAFDILIAKYIQKTFNG